MWNIKKKPGIAGKSQKSEDPMWDVFTKRATLCAAFVGLISVVPVLLRQVGVLGPITYSVARK